MKQKTTERPELLSKLSREYDHKYSFRVRSDQSIHDVVNSEEHRSRLPVGHCKMVFYDPRSYELVFPKKSPRETGKNPDGQNIFTYFNNTGSRDYPKWRQIQEEMETLRIGEIEVFIFWDI